jgi:arylsulfatase A
MRYILCTGLLLSAFALPAADQPKTIEAKTKIHRLNSAKRSAFDAFVYINRIPDAPEEGESPEDFAGRIYGRLANQEGRILLKLPPTMSRRAYFGFKTFLGSEGDANVNNCVNCHSAPDFSDGRSHITGAGVPPKPTPSLRNPKLSPTDLANVLRKKIAASGLKKSGKASDVAEAYSRMNLTETDIPNLVAFLGTLKDVGDEQFRELIIKSEVFDATQPEPAR